jgi:hypothetical protein
MLSYVEIMDTKLKIFCTVAETRSFTKTSRIVHLSQPAVSLQIQSLEEFFETKLFDKTEKKVSLTPAGKVLYEHAVHIMGHYNEVVKEINKLTGMMKGAVTLGASTTLGNYILPNIIASDKNGKGHVRPVDFDSPPETPAGQEESSVSAGFVQRAFYPERAGVRDKTAYRRIYEA